MAGGSITLSWPAKELSPNARTHFRVKAAATKAYRAEAYERAKMNLLPLPSEGGIGLRFDFHPPDKRRRDLDNMLASIKGAIDGIADAHEVNDQRFGFWLSREEPVKGGKIIVTVVA
jgi:crossover junction endodeoxyribonuclease RusA